MNSKNYTFILSKSPNSYAKNLNENIDNSTIIYDSLISDQDLKKNNYCCLTETIKKNSAWDKAFYTLINNQEYLLNNHDYFYFIEDDVYCRTVETFHQLYTLLNLIDNDLVSNDIMSKKDSSHWHWWHKYKSHNMRSFNPLCRLSKLLISHILKYFIENKKFIFHEVLFVSVAIKNNLNILDFRNITQYNDIFGIFTHRPTINIKNIKDNKIYHPVKPIYETV